MEVVGQLYYFVNWSINPVISFCVCPVTTHNPLFTPRFFFLLSPCLIPLISPALMSPAMTSPQKCLHQNTTEPSQYVVYRFSQRLTMTKSLILTESRVSQFQDQHQRLIYEVQVKPAHVQRFPDPLLSVWGNSQYIQPGVGHI